MDHASTSLLPFVPRIARRHFLGDDGPPAGPRCAVLSAVVLFADVSGFTALVEELAEQGERGAERVQEILNRCFGPLTDLIEAAGGEVLTYPGDAALGLFLTEAGEDLGAPVRRAVRCALEVQASLDQLEVAGTAPLRLRVALGAGAVWAASTGGTQGRYEILVRGEPVEQLEPTLARAKPGEVLLSGEAAQYVSRSAEGESRGDCLRVVSIQGSVSQGGPVTRPSEERRPSPEALRAYVPRSVQARLAAGQREWFAEFRQVSVVFVNVSGLDLATQGALDQLQAAVAAVQTAVLRYGGSVNQLVEDEKGTTFVIGFGLALHAHEDDPVRAILSGIELRESLLRQGLDARVGITTERIFTGWRGSDRRAEYALIGSAVNLAARLMKLADGVLCDAPTRRSARRRILFEKPAPVRVKGRSEAVAVYRPRAEKKEKSPGGFSDRKTIIGRDPECRMLERKLTDLENGRSGGVVFVEGEPGIGKTQLVCHLLDAAQATAVRSLAGAADAIEQRTPYLAWKPVMASLFGRSFAEDVSSLRERITDLLGKKALERFAVLNPVLPLELPESAFTERMAPEGRSEIARELMVELLAKVAERSPLLILLEDGHWMDSASWDLAEAVSVSLPRVLLVVTLRPMPQRLEACRRLLDDIATTVVRLDVLPPAEALALICRRLDVDSVPEEVATFIQERAEGHPLFTEELTLALRDQGPLSIVEGECRLAGNSEDLHALSLPENVSGVVSSRIDRLTPQQQLTLKVAAVLGRDFSLDALRAVHPIATDHESLPAQLKEMTGLGLLRMEEEQAGVSHVFRHAIIQETIYELLPYTQRRELHRNTAHWFEQRYADDLERFGALLAHHFERAGDGPKAIEHLARAGERALTRDFANEEAAHFFERLLALDSGTAALGDLSDREQRGLRARWRRQLGEAYCKLGRHPEGVPYLRQALELLGHGIPESPTRRHLELGWRLIAGLARRPSLKPAKDLEGSERVELEEVAYATETLAAACYTTGEALIGTLLILRGRPIGERLGPSPELTYAYSNYAGVASVAGRNALACTYAELALHTAETCGDPYALGLALSRGQLFRITNGDWEVAHDLERASAIFDQTGNHYHWEECNAILARVELNRGDPEVSMQRNARVLERARGSRSVVHQLWAMGSQAEASYRLGLLDEAIGHGEAVLELVRESGSPDPNTPFQVGGILASAWLRKAGPEATRRFLRPAAEAMRSGGSLGYASEAGFRGLLEAHCALWEAGGPGAAESRREAKKILRLLGRRARARPALRPTLHRARAARAAVRGRKRLALREWRVAAEAAGALGLPFDGGLAHLDLAQALPPEDPERELHLEAARKAFGETGAAFELARVEEVTRG